jgi:hypothetical protein
MNAMLNCQTYSCGTSAWCCGHCLQFSYFPLSCGHRSCPQCQHHTTCDWLARQQAKLLPDDYYLVTFTLPCELRAVARRHPKRGAEFGFTGAIQPLYICEVFSTYSDVNS